MTPIPVAELLDEATRAALSHYCAICCQPATCLGAYEMAAVATPACDDCCGHANEDGACSPIVCCYCDADTHEAILLRVGPGRAPACHRCATLTQVRSEIAYLALCQATMQPLAFDRMITELRRSGGRLSS
jgi:hypothetical protein